MEFPRPQYWSGLPFPSPGDLSNSGIKPGSPKSPALLVDSFLLSYQRSPSESVAIPLINVSIKVIVLKVAAAFVADEREKENRENPAKIISVAEPVSVKENLMLLAVFAYCLKTHESKCWKCHPYSKIMT